jgi:FkbM family methyltransferase
MGQRIGFLKQRIFSALRKRVLGKYAQGVIYRASNGLLAVSLDDVAVGKKLGFKGAYDIPEITALQKLFSQDDVIYIVGTHIGALLVPIARRCCQVIGYEANPETFDYVRFNTHLNNLTNTRLFNLAAGDASRTIQFYQNRSNSGGSKIKPKQDQYMYNYDSPSTIDVRMVSLDEHAAVEKLPVPHGVIMDIEGAEYFALKGMPSILEKTGFLYIEYVPHHLKNVSGVSNEEFFELILPHFNYARFMRIHAGVINLRQERDAFFALVRDFSENEKSDDILFLKTL